MDGNHVQENPETTQTCSSTESTDTEPWWCVDMEALAIVDSILVYGQSGLWDHSEKV